MTAVRVPRLPCIVVAGWIATSWLTGCGYKCSRNADCQGGIGGCEPVEAWCENGTCQTRCSRTCRTDIVDVNSCEGGGVCTDTAATTSSFGWCTVLPISCTSSSECPAYRPRDDAGIQSAWSCADGMCLYPGLDYTRGRP